MSRKIIMAGKLDKTFKKPSNLQEIISKINKFKIDKMQKYILFVSAIRIIENNKENIRIIKQLEEMRNELEIYNNFPKSKYISNIINEVNMMPKDAYMQQIDELIKYVQEKNIQI